MNKWQPIETAPKDGTKIIAMAKYGDVMAVSWLTAEESAWEDNGHPDDYCSVWWDGVDAVYSLVYWMPLPEPPR